MELQEILDSKNIAKTLSKSKDGSSELQKIANQVTKQYTNDIQSLSDKLDLLTKIVKFALNVNEGKSFPWENASNVIFPLIATAAIEFNAKAYPEICQDGFIVKAKTYGNDKGEPMLDTLGKIMIDPTNESSNEPIMQNVGLKEKRGERVANFMNWQLNENIENWEENQDKLLLALPIVGMMFKKTYWNEIEKKVASELIFPDKLIINNAATSFAKAPATHIRELYTHQIQEKIRSGIFDEFIYDEDNTVTDDFVQNALSNAQDDKKSELSNNLHIFLEQHCWYDLDGDGFLEPYAITIHKSSNTVVRMVKRFDKNDITRNDKKEISFIRPINIFTSFSFMPSPDGSFYSIGLGQLLFNLNKTINSNINQLVDAGTLANTGGGFISKSLKIRGGNFKFRPGEYKQVDSFGGPLRDSFASFPTPEPSQTLFALIGFLVDTGKELGSLRDVLTGEQAGNIQATTMMALVEQGVKQFKAIYKRVYLSLKKEFKLIVDINAENLTNKKYAEVLDEEVGDVDIKADFNKKGYNLVPVADISSITNLQRMAKGNFLMQFLQDPYINGKLVRQRIFDSYNIEDKDKLIVEPPPPSPDMGTILAKAEVDKAANRLKEIELKAIEAMGKMESMKFEKEKMIAEIEKIRSEALKNIADAAANEQDIQLRTIVAGSEAIRKDIEANANVRAREIKREVEQRPEIEQPNQ